MRLIKKYDSFLESNHEDDYDIYEFFNDIKLKEWHKCDIPDSHFKWGIDHFIGEGWYDKIKSHVDKIWTALSKVDLEEINDRMVDVYDYIPLAKQRYNLLAVVYGRYDRYNDSNQTKYNGTMTVPNINDESRKMSIILHIAKEMIYPTLYVGGFKGCIEIRTSHESRLVTDKKWQCQNFNIDDYKEFGIVGGAKMLSDEGKMTTIYPSVIDDKKSYSTDNVLKMHQPAIYMSIGNNDYYGGINLKKLENNIDEVLETILPQLDYEDVLFDYAKGARKFDDNFEISDYTVRILLKL